MHTRHGHFKIATKIGLSYLFLSIGISIVSTIWSVYLNSFLHNTSWVGFITSFFTILETVAFIALTPFIEKINKTKMFIISLIFFAVFYFLLSVYSNIYLVIILGILIAIFSSLRITLFGLIVRDKTDDDSVSKMEGLMYTLLNSAWFVGPLIAGYVAKVYGFKSVFFLTTIFILISIFSFSLFDIKDNKKQKHIDRHMLKVTLKFFTKRERTLNYIFDLAVGFWWAFIYIYVPIYIINKGFGDLWLGVFLSAVTVPLILCEYFFGKMAGKRGFKKLFFIGFMSLGIIAISCFFIPNIYIIGGLLVLASISISMIEPTAEAYFMDIVSEEERDKYYGIYTTSITIGNLVGTLPAAILLLFLPFNYLFLLIGIPMIVLSFLTLIIKDSYEFKKKKKNKRF